MTEHHVVDVIVAKRDGGELTDDQIDWVIDAYTRGVVAEEQMAALAMAILLRGMNRRETSRWTLAMIRTGRTLEWTHLGRPTADKHSTGGVGDKITLPLAPLVAACGVAVPQLSGRGLGHTGGTLDKLEAIPGWRADLSIADITRQLTTIGAVVCAAGSDLVPADRKLYALRDVTGTVESIPLIASSIMSKKIASGPPKVVLDVKVGTGAFMKRREDAAELARTMVALGVDAGVTTSAALTQMSTPLGRKVGNALEVAESVEVLAGGGPSDVVELTLVLAEEMLRLAGVTGVDLQRVLASGRAMDTWRSMILGQGGDPDATLPTARHRRDVRSTRTGVMTRLDALAVGTCAWRLGAGREAQGDAVSAAAGVELHVKQGEPVGAGDVVLTMHADDEAHFETAEEALVDAYDIQDPSHPDAQRAPEPLLLEWVRP